MIKAKLLPLPKKIITESLHVYNVDRINHDSLNQMFDEFIGFYPEFTRDDCYLKIEELGSYDFEYIVIGNRFETDKEYEIRMEKNRLKNEKRKAKRKQKEQQRLDDLSNEIQTLKKKYGAENLEKILKLSS